jgi:putative membrane protein
VITKWFRRRQHPNVLRGVATGITAGIAATLIMDQFQKLSSAGKKAAEKQIRLVHHESEEAIERDQRQKDEQAALQEDSTEKVARKIAHAAGKDLQQENKKKAGQAVHYAFGTLMGAIYGVSAELVPEVTTGGGTAYGTLLFLAADEVAVPAFQLSPAPTETPATDHLQHWASHVVYGGSLELIRSLLRRLM